MTSVLGRNLISPSFGCPRRKPHSFSHPEVTSGLLKLWYNAASRCDLPWPRSPMRTTGCPCPGPIASTAEITSAVG